MIITFLDRLISLAGLACRRNRTCLRVSGLGGFAIAYAAFEIPSMLRDRIGPESATPVPLWWSVFTFDRWPAITGCCRCAGLRRRLLRLSQHGGQHFAGSLWASARSRPLMAVPRQALRVAVAGDSDPDGVRRASFFCFDSRERLGRLAYLVSRYPAQFMELRRNRRDRRARAYLEACSALAYRPA